MLAAPWPSTTEPAPPRMGQVSAEPLVTLAHVPDAPSPGPRRLVAVLTGLQAAALVGFAAFYVYELVIGEGSDAARVLMSALLILVGGVGLAVLARGWIGGAHWPRTPTIVWSALLVPVALGLVQGNQALAGWLVLGLATVTAVAALKVPTPEARVPGVDTHE